MRQWLLLIVLDRFGVEGYCTEGRPREMASDRLLRNTAIPRDKPGFPRRACFSPALNFFADLDDGLFLFISLSQILIHV